MTTPRAAAIYARISSDPGATHAGVERQLTDCRKKAEALGWGIGGEYVDNDLSAYSGKHRPEYARMMTDLADGLLDAVVVYNLDRLTRRPSELETFHDAIQAAGVAHVQFVTGEANMLTDDGLLQTRILGAFAAKESANISRRVRRKVEEVAAQGRPHGGARPFGYEDDKIGIRETEAGVYRQLVARFLAGESTRSLANWLNDQGIPTVTGKTWTTTTIKGMLINPRYVGLRAHRGTVVGRAVWEPLITDEDHRRILAKFAAKKTSGRRVPQRYLLSGMLRCGKCGNTLFSSARTERGKTTRRYVCSSGPDHGGCGKLTIAAAPVEDLIANFVLYRLDTPELADTLAGRSSADARTQELTTALDADTQQLEDLALAYANRDISMREWMTAKKPITQRLEATQRQLAAVTRTSALTGIVGDGAELRRTWDTLNLGRQNAIVAALVDRLTIGPGQPGARAVDPHRISVQWRH
ncbi:hypothetical protein ENKNEFLB_03195 [Nocardioides aquaticus]|uniref:Recombinase family protein n=1 Tax=Nocardioides aquaticus TaxID=160826 RepID=A0ABX8EKL5_9ACTN|nr:recombinase family protein [Nocardioides aquaticus]QVT80794.1 hypothetical protein ENKNEFLB_03195 [Nocardioides aquaticus]